MLNFVNTIVIPVLAGHGILVLWDKYQASRKPAESEAV